MPDMASTEHPASPAPAGTHRPATPAAAPAPRPRRMPLTAVRETVRPGTVWDVTNYCVPEGNPLHGTTRRTVTRAAAGRFYLSIPGTGGGESRVDWPRASQVDVDADGTIRLHDGTDREPGKVYLTLAPVKDQPS